MTIDPEFKKRFEKWDTSSKLGDNICTETTRFLLAELARIKQERGNDTHDSYSYEVVEWSDIESVFSQFIFLCAEAQK